MAGEKLNSKVNLSAIKTSSIVELEDFNSFKALNQNMKPRGEEIMVGKVPNQS